MHFTGGPKQEKQKVVNISCEELKTIANVSPSEEKGLENMHSNTTL